jgi:hypothetical protein
MNIFDDFNNLPEFAELSNPPGRSRLFSLVPARLGQPMQESLLSFLIRTSRAHSVNPRRLVKEVLVDVDPTIGALSYAGFFKRLAKTVNGIGQYAEQFVSVFESATGANELRKLTMLPWQGLFPHNGQGMLAAHPRWCPACLLGACKAGEELHFPLAWSLDAFRVCPIHRCRMEQCCPQCGKHQSFIPQYPDLGTCSECLKPLVANNVLSVTTSEQPQVGLELWAAETIGKMIAYHSANGRVPTEDDFRQFVAAQVLRVSDGNRAAFCRAIGFPDRALDGWLSKGKRPSITQMLSLCYGVKVRPTEMGECDKQSLSSSRSLLPSDPLIRRTPCLRLKVDAREQLQASLKAYLLDARCLPVSKIADKIDVPARCLRYWFPELCSELAARHRTAVKARSDAYRAEQGRRVREVVWRLMDEGRYPSRRKVNGLLRKERMSLAQAHLLQAYRDALKR